MEWKTRDWLMPAGYIVIRAAGSKGPLDLVALGHDIARLIQVKANGWPGTEERENLERFKCPSYGRVEVWRWDDYARAPKVRIWNGSKWIDQNGGAA